MEKNSEVLSTLDSFKDYAEEYEKRRRAEESSQAGPTPDQIKENLALMKKKSIAEEIAETLRKIKEKEIENSKKIEEENRRKEEKKRKEDAIKARIQEELEKIRRLEELQAEQTRKQEEKREAERRKLLEQVCSYTVFLSRRTSSAALESANFL